MPFVAQLRHIRIHTGLSLHDLAERSGLESTYLEQVEAGQEIPSWDALESLAEALDAPFYQLFYDDAPPDTPRLSRRASLDELLARHYEPKPENGLFGKMRTLCDELNALLR